MWKKDTEWWTKHNWKCPAYWKIERAPEMKEEKPNEITETKQNKMKKDNKQQQQQPASNK